MFEEVINALDVLWLVLPDVYLKALVIFAVVGGLKAVGVLKEDAQAQFGNVAITYFVSGGKVPEGGPEAVALFMTMVVAGVYYHVWKWAKPYLAKFFQAIGQKFNFQPS